MFLLFGFCLLFRALAFTEGVSQCSSSNSYDENMNILLQNASGVIETPGYPISYPYKLTSQCRWKLIAPEGKMVRLKFLYFQMNTYDWVEITDDVNLWNTYLVMPDGLMPSFTVYSTGRHLGIKVQGKVGNTGPGFSAVYTMVPAAVSSGTCNPDKNTTTVQMAGEGMSFVTPKFPQYQGNGTCRWNITASPGMFVKLTFWSFRASGCNQTYAEVYDVTNSTRTFLGKFCGRQQVVYSKGNNLLVLGSFRQGGFSATYESVKSVPARYSCLINSYSYNSLQLNEMSGEFASFNYPLLYPNGARCSWELKAPAGYLIQLTFHSFDLENSQDCKKDYVEVRQGVSYTAAMNPTVGLVGRFCGSSLPTVIRSKYTNLFVYFVSDRTGVYPGFHASYAAVPDPAVGPCRLEGVDNVIPMTGDAGRIFSPQFPLGTAPRRRMCTWIITVPEGHLVKLRFTSSQFGDTCRNTSLEIRDGESSSSDLLKLYCEWPIGLVRGLFSSSRHLWVRFQSPKADWTWTWKFSAVFEAVTQLPASFACKANNEDFKLTSETGSLASYNYPLPYDHVVVECTWVISVGRHQKIELSFDFFNLSGSASDCLQFDYVDVGDGDSLLQNLIQRFCGSEKPSTVTSKGSTMWVTFESNGRTRYPGFKASYKSVASTVAILKVVAICVGVIILCVVIGIVGYKYYKSRCNQAQPMQRMHEDEAANVLL